MTVGPAPPGRARSSEPGEGQPRQRWGAMPRALAICSVLAVIAPAPVAPSAAGPAAAPVAFPPGMHAARMRPDGLLGLSLAALAMAGLLGIALLRKEAEPVDLLVAQTPWLAAAPPPPLPDLQRVQDTVPLAMAHLDQAGRFLSVNPPFARLAGRSVEECRSCRLAEILPAGLATPIEAAHAEVLATGRPVLERPVTSGPEGEERHLRVSAHPVPDDDGRTASISLVLLDATERVRAERAGEMLRRELNHRVKNTLATVQSMTIATLRRADADPRGSSATLVARLMALARIHDLLATHAWAAVELQDVARVALAPCIAEHEDRFSLDGPGAIRLRPQQAQALALALHELATNAVRHGALSAPGGGVALRWRQDPASGRTLVDWIESGGPPVVAPSPDERGFGSRLLERGLGSDFGPGAEMHLVFAPAGVEAHLGFVAAPDPPGPQRPTPGAGGPVGGAAAAAGRSASG